MEEKQQKSINGILPLELIQRILLRIPVKDLGRLKCVSKLWHTLISDPDFAESHFNLSLAPTHTFLYTKDYPETYLVRLEEVFNGDNYEVKEVYFPFRQNHPPEFSFMGSCRGFVLLSRRPKLFVVWNPLTGFNKGVPYPSLDFVHRPKAKNNFDFPGDASVYGFGYDASRNDYLVVVAWFDGDCQHLDCLSLRTRSWIILDPLPKPFGFREWRSPGLFLNGSIHWLSNSIKKHYNEGLLIFDLKERSFSKMSLPEQLIIMLNHVKFVILGGCLALYSPNYAEGKTYIWVMKEYKVNSSWTLYEVPCLDFEPLCLSNGSDIIAVEPISFSRLVKFAKYNIREELLQHFTCPSRIRNNTYYYENYGVYTESLLPFPSDSKRWSTSSLMT